MTGPEPLLSLEDVTVEFRDESAVLEVVPESVKSRFGWNADAVRPVNSVSLDIDDQEVVALIGESGSGKTTLGKTAIGLQEPTSGAMKYGGYDVSNIRKNRTIDSVRYADVRQSLQVVHQDPGASLNPYKTLQTILKRPLRRWFPEMSHADCRERILNVFKEVGMTPATDYLER